MLALEQVELVEQQRAGVERRVLGARALAQRRDHLQQSLVQQETAHERALLELVDGVHVRVQEGHGRDLGDQAHALVLERLHGRRVNCFEVVFGFGRFQH